MKLFVVVDCLTIFHFIWGVSPWSLRFQKYLDRVVWFLSNGLEKECLWFWSLCFQFPTEMPMYTLSPSLCSMGQMHAWYTTFSKLHHPPKGPSSFLLQLQGTLSSHYFYLVCLVKKLATIVEGDQKALFSIATTPRCKGGRYSFRWIAPLYPRYIPYIAEC